MPARKGIEQEILNGMYLLQEGGKSDKKVQLLGSGVILQEVLAAAQLLKDDFGVEANVWSCPSFNQMHRDIMEVERFNRLNPTKEQKSSICYPSIARSYRAYRCLN